MARNPGEDAQHPKGLVIPKPKKRPPATNGEEGFINPYNFVRWAPAVHKCAPPTHEKFAGRSGRITVELTNITPLCIPDPKETDKFPIKDDPKGKERFWKPFMRVDGRPYIPGSSLKGMLRSVAEAVSNSCYLVFADKGDDPAVFRDNRDFAVNYRRLARLKEKADGSYVVQDVHPDIGIPPVPPCEPRQPTDIWKARNNLYRNNRQRLFPDDPNRTKPAPTDVEERFWQGNQSFSWYDFLRGMFGDTERRDCGPDGRPLVVRRRGKVVQNNRPKDPVRRPGEPVIIRWPVADQRTKSAEYRIETNVQNLYQRVTGSKTFRRFHDEAVNLKRWQVDYLKPGNNELFWYRRRFK